MIVKYSPDPEGYKRMNSEELRKTFLLNNLFQPGKVEMVYSDIDRSITGGAVPADLPLKLEAGKKEIAADYFTERREVGIINVGNPGRITVDGKVYEMENKDCLYSVKGIKKFFLTAMTRANLQYYISSYPAHHQYPVSHMKFSEATPVKLGSEKDANKRTIYKYIHGGGIRSSQIEWV